LQRISFSCAHEVGAGRDGTVEIADSGTIYRYSGNFLLRTRPLWLQSQRTPVQKKQPRGVVRGWSGDPQLELAGGGTR